MVKQAVFTITAGRTGTGYLAELFKRNLDCEAHHEFLGPRDHGLRTPDVSHMRQFNCIGNTPWVQEFWERKWNTLPETADLYVETNHTLAKAGLLHNLPTKLKVDIILLRRSWPDAALSMRSRFDMLSMSDQWLWHLDREYPANILSPETHKGAGWEGDIIRYLGEMEARQEWARLKFADRCNFIDCNLEDIVTESGAQEFLSHWGFDGEVVIPPKINANDVTPRWGDESRFAEKVADAQRKFDAKAIAEQYLERTDDSKDWELFDLPECEGESLEEADDQQGRQQ